MFVASGLWCLADVSSVSPSSEQTEVAEWVQQRLLCKVVAKGSYVH